jgi:hypothetical protein
MGIVVIYTTSIVNKSKSETFGLRRGKQWV